jgi:hypothetical protein
VQIASRRAELPATMAAFAAGELSMDQVAPIAAKVPAWAEEEAARLARNATVAQLRKVAARYPFAEHVPPDDPPVEPPVVESVSLYPDDDGSWRLSGRLDAEHGRILDAALREATDALFQRDGEPVTLVDALVESPSGAWTPWATPPAGTATGSTSTSTPTAPPPTTRAATCPSGCGAWPAATAPSRPSGNARAARSGCRPRPRRSRRSCAAT